MPKMTLPGMLRPKDHGAPSVFRPEALVREARRQLGTDQAPLPDVCLLDPDGDILRYLRQEGRARPCAAWPCYHSEMNRFTLAGREIGIVACAVGAPYAVLVAEQMRVCGVRLIVSLTSAGQIAAPPPLPAFMVIDRALRDEGTSHHYAAPTDYSEAPDGLADGAQAALAAAGMTALRGASWTTDAPFRETEAAVAAAHSAGALAVEMEAAALYAFAAARGVPVLCLAHVTNTMGQDGNDFEKGEAGGAKEALALLEVLIAGLAPTGPGST